MHVSRAWVLCLCSLCFYCYVEFSRMLQMLSPDLGKEIQMDLSEQYACKLRNSTDSNTTGRKNSLKCKKIFKCHRLTSIMQLTAVWVSGRYSYIFEIPLAAFSWMMSLLFGSSVEPFSHQLLESVHDQPKVLLKPEQVWCSERRGQQTLHHEATPAYTYVQGLLK